MATRCPPLPKDTIPALRPGDMNKMFERIVAAAPGNVTDQSKRLLDDGMPNYTVHVHSRPSESLATEISLEIDKALPPWIITFENFVTPEECAKMIELGWEYHDGECALPWNNHFGLQLAFPTKSYTTGYKRSEDVGKENIDGTLDGVQSDSRTSENAWCSIRNGCRVDQTAQRLHERISKVLGIPAANSEDFQILRYEVGQFYRTQ